MHSPLWIAAVAVLAAAACRDAPATPVACPRTWRPASSADSSVAFCVPSAFARVRRGNLWTGAAGAEPPPFVGATWVSVVQVPAAEVAAGFEPWPPSLLRDTSTHCADCYVATGVAVHWDSAGGRLVRVEMGRVTGGFAGDRDTPALVAAWPTARGDWILVQGRGAVPASLDTLRAIVRTVRAVRQATAAA